MRLLDPLFTTDPMREIFSDAQRLQRMLDFEAALAGALVMAAIAPASVLPAIKSQCKTDRFEFAAIAREAALAGNIAIPLVKALSSLVAREDTKAATFVHWGATSQDAIDTGLVLQLRDALELIEEGLANLHGALSRLAETHETTIMAGRTWLQQGPPVTFGLKVAGWLGAIERHQTRIERAREQAMVLQFGGAVGTLAALDGRGLEVAAALAHELKIALPELPWHAHRDRLGEVATTLGLLVGTLGKIARDVSLMAQTEIDEVQEPAAPGRGGSSTMPHKRNPVGSAVALAAAIRVPGLVSTMLTAMVQEHERGLGGWHAEWETLPEICMLTAGALGQMTQTIEGLEVHPEKMRENLDVTHGLVLSEAVSFALAAKIGKKQARQIVEEACRQALDQRRQLRDVLFERKDVTDQLSMQEISQLLDPNHYLGSAGEMMKSVLSPSRKPRKKAKRDSSSRGSSE